jgi:hypothetical protein
MRLTLGITEWLCLIILFSQSACVRRAYEEPLDITCAQSLQTAQQQLASARSKLEKDETTQLENLIRAATIEQQHNKFPACAEQAQRAVILLEQYSKRE